MSQANSCDSCDFETTELKQYEQHDVRMKMVKVWLCELCASTPAGNALEYPDQFRGQAETLKTICFVGNTLLAAIEGSRPKIRARWLEGPILVGEEFIWEPALPNVRERVRVTRTKDLGSIHQNRIWTVSLDKPETGEVWNDESRFREACVRVEK